MTASDQVVVQFRYHGGEYRLEVDKSAAQRLADAEQTFAGEPRPARLRARLRSLTHRPTRA